MANHIATAHSMAGDREKFKCEACGKHYNTKRDFKKHFKFYHITAKCIFPGCDFVGSKSQLHFHNTKHTFKYKCKYCGFNCRSKVTQICHKTKYHSNDYPNSNDPADSKICEGCLKEFLNPSLWKAHECKLSKRSDKEEVIRRFNEKKLAAMVRLQGDFDEGDASPVKKTEINPFGSDTVLLYENVKPKDQRHKVRKYLNGKEEDFKMSDDPK
jgi:hypothetical protein